jgi:UPF0755 protein
MIKKAVGICDEWCRERRMYDRIFPAAFLVGVLIFLIYFVTIAPPLNFPTASLIKIPEGSSVLEVGNQLAAAHVIHSARLFELAVRLESGSGDKIIAGEYLLPGPENTLTVAARLIGGDFELIPIRISIAEGATVREITALLAQKIPDFDSNTFLADALPEEGYLYPDTYFFLPGEDPQIVLHALLANFALHVTDNPKVAQAILAFGKPLPDVVTMASLVEKEAAVMQDRQTIAGILWKRISIGMPLQVDAVFPYIIGKSSLQLTKADLQTDSPYNTYTNKGLPPGPIGSPSTAAILAVVTPIKTKYIYYLSDSNSQFHFSVTYAGQLANMRKYLQN